MLLDLTTIGPPECLIQKNWDFICILRNDHKHNNVASCGVITSGSDTLHAVSCYIVGAHSPTHNDHDAVQYLSRNGKEWACADADHDRMVNMIAAGNVLAVTDRSYYHDQAKGAELHGFWSVNHRRLYLVEGRLQSPGTTANAYRSRLSRRL